jgi:hypothetical protein
MVDILFGILCKRLNIIQIAITRPEGWLIDLNPTPEQTLYHEFKDNDTMQRKAVINSLPWGHESIQSIMQKSLERSKNTAIPFPKPPLRGITLEN